MFKLIKLFPVQTNINIMKYAKYFITFTSILFVLSIISLFIKPLNLGIDFSGGVMVEIQTSGPANITKIRQDLKSFSPEIQAQGDRDDIILIRLPQGKKNETEITKMLDDVKKVLGPKVEYRNTQIVGPKVGADLIRNGTLAVIMSLLIISLYIWIRFELPFAVGTGLSLLHDVVLALGMLSITGLEFSLTTLASLLTLAGYSINDTVVIYDRIRENIKRYKQKPLKEVLNLSINETLSRSILTSTTTFLAVLMIFLFGGEVLKSFSAVMLFGIIIGTYSSIFIATTTLLIFKRKNLK